MSSIITIEAIDNFTGDGLDIIGTNGLFQLDGSLNDGSSSSGEGSALGDRIVLGGRDNKVSGNDGDDLIFGGGGNDTIGGGNGDDIIIGGPGDDTLYGFNGNDIIEGNEGDDVLIGGKGIDYLFGGDGDDTLRGGVGADLLEGGAGQDVFEFNASDFAADTQDVIDDFELGEDSIVIKGLAEGSTVEFTDTGLVVDGKEIAKFDSINPDAMKIEENDNGDFEIM